MHKSVEQDNKACGIQL